MGTIGKIKGAYVDWLDVSRSPHRKTGKIPTNESTGKPYTTLKLIKVFANQAEAQKAASELSASNNVSPDSVYPALWVNESSVDDRLAKAKNLTYESWSDLAEQMELVDASGFVAKTANGKDVDAAFIISKMLDMPEAMIRKEMQSTEEIREAEIPF